MTRNSIPDTVVSSLSLSHFTGIAICRSVYVFARENNNVFWIGAHSSFLQSRQFPALPSEYAKSPNLCHRASTGLSPGVGDTVHKANGRINRECPISMFQF